MTSNEDSENVNVLKHEKIPNVEFKNKYISQQKFCAEFLGTTFLVFVVTGIPLFANVRKSLDSSFDQNAYNGGFEGALVLTSMIYIFGPISGGHFNPAVTIPMFLRNKITMGECTYYIIAQILGGFFGSILVALCCQGNFDNLCPNTFEKFNSWSWLSCFICEFILTFILVSVIFASGNKRNNFGNLTRFIIGTTLYFLGITGNNVSGASLNPARSISPAIIMEFMGDNKPIKQLWLYILGPILGGISAGYVAKLFE